MEILLLSTVAFLICHFAELVLVFKQNAQDMVARAVRLDHTAATASAIRLRANACGHSRTLANPMGYYVIPIGMIAVANVLCHIGTTTFANLNLDYISLTIHHNALQQFSKTFALTLWTLPMPT